MLVDLLSLRLLPIGVRRIGRGAEMEMNSVVFARFIAEGLEQRQHQSRRQSADRPGAIRRFSRAAFRLASDYLPRAGHRMIRLSKHPSAAR